MNEAKKILVIDDDQMLLKLLSSELEKIGFVVDVALDGEEGLRKVRDVRPDVILLDIVLPKLDGMSMLKKLKQDPQTASIPVVMLTNLQTNESVAEAVEAGSAEYLVKVHYTPEDICKKVKEMANR